MMGVVCGMGRNPTFGPLYNAFGFARPPLFAAPVSNSSLKSGGFPRIMGRGRMFWRSTHVPSVRKGIGYRTVWGDGAGACLAYTTPVSLKWYGEYSQTGTFNVHFLL